MAPGSRVQRPSFMQMTVFLPQFVREKKRDDQERNDEKNPEYYVLVHDGLQLPEIDFIVEHHLFPKRAALVVRTRHNPARDVASPCTHLPAPLCRFRLFPALFCNDALHVLQW